MNSLFIGRFQPLHEGHIDLIKKVLNEKKPIVVALRDTPIDDKNPYSVEQRKEMFKKEFGNKVEVIVIPDISEVCYGRDVGYKIRKINLSNSMENISASNIRQGKIWWITGNTESGKTTLASQLKNVIHLDGDEMRTVWKLGFSKKDRCVQNIRIARLARMLKAQGYNVVISTICPYKELRKKVQEITGCKFVYLKGGKKPSKECPYEYE